MAFTSMTDQLPVVLAYLDPGSGSLMLQVLIAGMLSGMFVMKSYFTMIRQSALRFFRKNA